MNGVHDMGGMDGFGKVEAEPNEPPFHETWEGRVLAMQRAMGYAGAWHIDDSRYAQETLPPQTYLAVSYYQRWELAMEKNLLRARLRDRGRARRRPCAAARPSPCRASSRRMSCDAGMTRNSFFRQQQGPARFKPGDRVRTQEHQSADPHPPAALCARQGRHGRADPRLPRLSRFGRDRSRRRSAVALHGRVRRPRDLGRRTPIRR